MSDLMADIAGGIACFTINRPHAMNVMNIAHRISVAGHLAQEAKDFGAVVVDPRFT